MDDAGIAPTRRRLTMRDDRRMGEAGIFADGARRKLIVNLQRRMLGIPRQAGWQRPVRRR